LVGKRGIGLTAEIAKHCIIQFRETIYDDLTIKRLFDLSIDFPHIRCLKFSKFRPFEGLDTIKLLEQLFRTAKDQYKLRAESIEFRAAVKYLQVDLIIIRLKNIIADAIFYANAFDRPDDKLRRAVG
jgi:hypothetical protein